MVQLEEVGARILRHRRCDAAAVVMARLLQGVFGTSLVPLSRRVDARHMIFVGFVLTTLSLWEMTHFTADVGGWDIVRTGISVVMTYLAQRTQANHAAFAAWGS